MGDAKAGAAFENAAEVTLQCLATSNKIELELELDLIEDLIVAPVGRAFAALRYTGSQYTTTTTMASQSSETHEVLSGGRTTCKAGSGHKRKAAARKASRHEEDEHRRRRDVHAGQLGLRDKRKQKRRA
ncbi:hypothetical protein OPT61_g5421 [Boeremia exigua]|uniref:Uncharacterized protein n=1 Tax=Boeremia exigua TaxID=749465 RepID=A0ACC2IAH1_9PLEO|nr:hypothetical protein OPT61_g5421 [Boeremia exigua]